MLGIIAYADNTKVLYTVHFTIKLGLYKFTFVIYCNFTFVTYCVNDFIISYSEVYVPVNIL